IGPSEMNYSLERHARACRGHPRLSCGLSAKKTWMAGTSPAMTPNRWFHMTGTPSNLPVLKPFRLQSTAHDLPRSPFTARHGVLIFVALLLSIFIGEAHAGPGTPLILATILRWTPLLAQGFALNIAMSFLAMAIGTVLGFALGLGLIAVTRPVRATSWLITQFFRNAPWLVLLFYCIL